VRDALVDFLPEVSEVRIQAADEPGSAPRVEARTPDGWVALRHLGFGYQSQIAWLVDLASRMFEREYIEDLMRRHKMNLSAAAREAQIDRKHLRELIRKYALDPRQKFDEEEEGGGED
jgi:DNA-binding NtrC family response regulator